MSQAPPARPVAPQAINTRSWYRYKYHLIVFLLLLILLRFSWFGIKDLEWLTDRNAIPESHERDMKIMNVSSSLLVMKYKLKSGLQQELYLLDSLTRYETSCLSWDRTCISSAAFRSSMYASTVLKVREIHAARSKLFLEYEKAVDEIDQNLK